MTQKLGQQKIVWARGVSIWASTGVQISEGLSWPLTSVLSRVYQVMCCKEHRSASLFVHVQDASIFFLVNTLKGCFSPELRSFSLLLFCQQPHISLLSDQMPQLHFLTETKHNVVFNFNMCCVSMWTICYSTYYLVLEENQWNPIRLVQTSLSAREA